MGFENGNHFLSENICVLEVGGGGRKFKCRELKITPNEDKNISSLISFLVPFPVYKSDVHWPHGCLRFCESRFWYQ